MFHSILVPLDGSPFSEQALPLALSIARRAGIPLQVAHAHVSLAPLYADPRAGFENTLDPKFRAQEQVYLDGVIQRLAKVAPSWSVRHSWTGQCRRRCSSMSRRGALT